DVPPELADGLSGCRRLVLIDRVPYTLVPTDSKGPVERCTLYHWGRPVPGDRPARLNELSGWPWAREAPLPGRGGCATTPGHPGTRRTPPRNRQGPVRHEKLPPRPPLLLALPLPPGRVHRLRPAGGRPLGPELHRRLPRPENPRRRPEPAG